jgi:protein-disulfide isomerase
MRRNVVLVALLASCYRDAKNPQLEARVAKLEQRVAEQDRELAAVRSNGQATVESAALAAQIDSLNSKLDKVLTLGAGGGQPRAPRRGLDDSNNYTVSIGTSPVEGPANAKVTMIMAFDFACPYCRRSWDTVTALEKKYGPNLRVAFKNYVVHPSTAMYPAQAACAAGHQGKFRAMAELLWSKSFDTREFEADHIDLLAKEAKLDMKRYKVDIKGCADEVKAEMAELTKLGVEATPTFFINGHPIEGALPQENFETAIDAAIATP